jgi:hypothetical protein
MQQFLDSALRRRAYSATKSSVAKRLPQLKNNRSCPLYGVPAHAKNPYVSLCRQARQSFPAQNVHCIHFKILQNNVLFVNPQHHIWGLP